MRVGARRIPPEVEPGNVRIKGVHVQPNLAIDLPHWIPEVDRLACHMSGMRRQATHEPSTQADVYSCHARLRRHVQTMAMQDTTRSTATHSISPSAAATPIDSIRGIGTQPRRIS